MQGIVERLVGGMRSGWVRPSLRMRGRAVPAGGVVHATLILQAEGRGGRLRDVAIEVLQVKDGAVPGEEVVLTGRIEQDFVVRPGVEVTFPIALELPGRLPPSGLGARYRIRIHGRCGLRRVAADELLVVLPEENDASALRAVC